MEPKAWIPLRFKKEVGSGRALIDTSAGNFMYLFSLYNNPFCTSVFKLTEDLRC